MSIESSGLLDDNQNHGSSEESDKNERIEETVEKESTVVGNKTCRIEKGMKRGRGRERQREKNKINV